MNAPNFDADVERALRRADGSHQTEAEPSASVRPAEIASEKSAVGRGPGSGNTLAQAQRVLAVVAHSDDESIGPGATLYEFVQGGLEVYLAVLAAADPTRRRESEEAARRLGLPPDRFFAFDFPDGELASQQASLRKALEQLREKVEPDIVITHNPDMHPDHGVVSRLVRQVFARQGVSILQFKIPQPVPTHWSPRVFVRVGASAVQFKLKDLFAQYPSQNCKDYFDIRVHQGLLAEAGHAAGVSFAEAFECGRLCLQCCKQCGTLRLATAGVQAEVEGVGNAHCLRVVLEVCRHGCAVIILGRASPREKGNHSGRNEAP